MRKYLFTAILIHILISGFSIINRNNKSAELISKTENTNENIKNENVLEILSEPAFVINVSDPKVLFETAHHVMLVKITKINEVTNYNAKIKQYISPFTIGTAEILINL